MAGRWLSAVLATQPTGRTSTEITKCLVRKSPELKGGACSHGRVLRSLPHTRRSGLSPCAGEHPASTKAGGRGGHCPVIGLLAVREGGRVSGEQVATSHRDRPVTLGGPGQVEGQGGESRCRPQGLRVIRCWRQHQGRCAPRVFICHLCPRSPPRPHTAGAPQRRVTQQRRREGSGPC